MNRKQALIGIDSSFTGKMAGRLYLGFKCPRILIQLILIQLIFTFFPNKLLKFLLYFMSLKGLNIFAQIIEKSHSYFSFWNTYKSIEHFAFQSSLMVPQPHNEQSVRNTLYTTTQPKPNRYRIPDVFWVSA